LVQEALILTLELVIQHHAIDPRALGLEPLRASQVRARELGIVGEFATLGDARIERLPSVTTLSLMKLEQVTTPLGQRDERGGALVAIEGRHDLNKAGRSQPIEVTVPHVCGATVVAEIVNRHDPEGPNRRQRSDLGAAEVVIPITAVHALALHATWQVEVARE